MRILVATFTFSPQVNGVASAAQAMVNTFRTAGHEVFVATGRDGPDQDTLESDDPHVRRFSIGGAPAIGAGFKGEIDAYLEHLSSLDPDLIVFHCWDTWPVELAIPIFDTLRAQTILLSHGYSSHLLDPRILPKGIWKWIRWLPHVFGLPQRLRRFSRVVFLSHKADLNRYFDAWVARLTGSSNTAVIPNGIDTQGWNDLDSDFRQRENLGDGVFFLYVANYFPGKNQMMALEAFTLANIPGSRLVFIGTELGTYGNHVRDAWLGIRDQFPGLEVRFLEKIERDRIISATKSCDVAVMSSRTEAQPLTILEAMACGKPFISTNVGCVSELDGGVVVRNRTEMANAMKHLASNQKYRNHLGWAARKDFDAQYSAAVVGHAWLDLVARLESQATGNRHPPASKCQAQGEPGEEN